MAQPAGQRFRTGDDPLSDRRLADQIGDSPSLVRDALLLFGGQHLGFGCYREVFAHPHRTDLVIKVETAAGSFMNVLEWEVWRELATSKWSGYFAPCEDISPSGAVLLMKRTQPIKAFPKALTLPDFFQDVKPENFGLLKGRIVCHDYSLSTLIRRNLRGTKLRPVKEF